MTAKKGGLGRGLGRGLDAMISDTAKPRPADKAQEKPLQQETNPKDKVFMVKLSQVEPNRKQPRKQFDEDALLELAESIKQFGVLQPLLVQKKDDYYEIIAGERRWRASKLAGVKEIPVIVKNFSEQEAVEISLIENIQRENLNPIEEAAAYKRLMEEFHLKQDTIAERVAKSRTAVTNSMRLLKLDERVQQMLIDEMLTTGHARALLSIENKELQYSTAVKVFDEKLSVRETEKLVKEVLNPAKKEKPQEKDRAQDLIYEQLEEKIKGIIGSKVAIHRKTKDKGKIEISYFSQEELERIVELLETIR
ncbi:MAG TPA: ParB/RepB/Spo0J family partition protein [Candidatus Blautia merdipullorum]|nr:ParB/RepB/Spo0J family partition protein [Candidatus Blautia merdipullorum]